MSFSSLWFVCPIELWPFSLQLWTRDKLLIAFVKCWVDRAYKYFWEPLKNEWPRKLDIIESQISGSHWLLIGVGIFVYCSIILLVFHSLPNIRVFEPHDGCQRAVAAVLVVMDFWRPRGDVSLEKWIDSIACLCCRRILGDQGSSRFAGIGCGILCQITLN